MRDLQQRLAALGHDPAADDMAAFGDATATAVRAFQRQRGLHDDGVCGPQTWSALVEAGHRLGERLLYLRQPMLRGDDVATLQRRLGALGFDAGRVDGKFGPQTAGALSDFQRNAGGTVDGVCGPATVAALERLGGRSDTSMPVAAVRELELLRRGPPTMRGRRVTIGESGGLHALATALSHTLTSRGAAATIVSHPEGSVQAASANTGGCDVFVGLALDPGIAGARTAYYAGHRYESPSGRRLAELLQELLPAVLPPDLGVRGMAVPVLLETKMPAVLCTLGPPAAVTERGGALAAAVSEALDAWTADRCA